VKLIHALIWIAGFLILSLFAGVVYQQFGERRDRRLHPPPGKFVDLGTHRLHLLEEGQGSPSGANSRNRIAS
jgi:hypothetical protein